MNRQNYEVLFPIDAVMKVYLTANSKDEAVQRGHAIAKEIEKDATDNMIPNLWAWRVKDLDDNSNHIVVIEKGDIDD